MSAAAYRDHALKASLEALLSDDDVDMSELPRLLQAYNSVCERLDVVPLEFSSESSVPSPPEAAAPEPEPAAPPFQNVPPEPHLPQKEIEVVDAGTVIGGGVQDAVENVDEVVAAGMSRDYTLKASLESLLLGGNINASDFPRILEYYNLICKRLKEVPTKFSFKRAILPPPELAAAPPLFGPLRVDEPIYSEKILTMSEKAGLDPYLPHNSNPLIYTGRPWGSFGLGFSNLTLRVVDPMPEPHLPQEEIEMLDAGTVIGGAVVNGDEVHGFALEGGVLNGGNEDDVHGVNVLEDGIVAVFVEEVRLPNSLTLIRQNYWDENDGENVMVGAVVDGKEEAHVEFALEGAIVNDGDGEVDFHGGNVAGFVVDLRLANNLVLIRQCYLDEDED